MKAKNVIEGYLTCRKCSDEIPDGESSQSYSRLEVGKTDRGIQIWCIRHDEEVAHLAIDELRFIAPDGTVDDSSARKGKNSTFTIPEKVDEGWSKSMIAYRTLLVVDTATPERLLKMGPASRMFFIDPNGLVLFISWYFWNERFNNPSNPYHKREREGHSTLQNAKRWIAPWYGGPAESLANFIYDMMGEYEEAYNLDNLEIDEFLEYGAKVLWFSCVVANCPYPHYTQAEHESVGERWTLWTDKVMPLLWKSCEDDAKKSVASKAKKKKKAKK